MSYSESGPDSNFAINSTSNFDPIFFNLNLNLMTLNLILIQCLRIQTLVFFSPYIYTFLNKLLDDFFLNYHNRINSYASNAFIMHIYFWHIITQKAQFYHTIKFAYFSFQVFLFVKRLAMKFNTQFIFNHILNFFVFFPHFVIFNQKKHFLTHFQVFDVSTDLR